MITNLTNFYLTKINDRIDVRAVRIRTDEKQQEIIEAIGMGGAKPLEGSFTPADLPILINDLSQDDLYNLCVQFLEYLNDQNIYEIFNLYKPKFVANGWIEDISQAKQRIIEEKKQELDIMRKEFELDKVTFERDFFKEQYLQELKKNKS